MKATTTILTLFLFACLSARGVNEKLRIDELGKVGVGTATPSTKLEVNGALTIANLGETEAPKAGTIKFDGKDFRGGLGFPSRSASGRPRPCGLHLRQSHGQGPAVGRNGT